MRIYALLCYNFKIRGNILQGGSNINNYDISKSYEDSLSTYDKKTKGIYYTPKTIVSYILNETLKNHDIIKNPQPRMTMLTLKRVKEMFPYMEQIEYKVIEGE